MMPAANPTAFPTATSAVTVDFDVVQVRQIVNICHKL